MIPKKNNSQRRQALYDMMNRGGMLRKADRKEGRALKLDEKANNLRTGARDKRHRLVGRANKNYEKSIDLRKRSLMMALGGLVKKYQNGGVEGDPTIDPNKIETPIDPTKNVSPRFTEEQALTFNDFPENEGMQQATSEGKIDAFNFSLPESGSLDDLDDQTKQDILGTDFGKEHLSGEGSLDEQYDAYARTVLNTINDNPEKALQAINAAIESGNESFEDLKGKSDQEKLDITKAYMTDKKIGNFHTALNLETQPTPKVQMFSPADIPGMIGRGQNLDPIVVAVGDRAIPNGKAMEFRDAAIEAGIDPSKSSPEFIQFFNAWVEENGFDDARQGIRRNNDNYAFKNQGYNLFRDQSRR